MLYIVVPIELSVIATAPQHLYVHGRHGKLGVSLVPVVFSVIATAHVAQVYTWSPCGLGATVVQIVPLIMHFVITTAHAAQIYTWSPCGLGAIVVPIDNFRVRAKECNYY